MKIGLIATLLLAMLTTSAAFAEKAKRQLAAATTNIVSRDQELGQSHSVRPEDLPAPGATKPVSNAPLTLPFDGQTPRVPEGFTASLFAKLEHPRRLLVLPNGDVIVAEQKPGYLTLLRATTSTVRPSSSSGTRRASTSPMGWPGATARSWWPTRTGSGRCRTR